MTRQTNLDIIRTACVAANPEIQHRFIDIGNDGNRYAVEDSIRLADVLLAMRESPELSKVNRETLLIQSRERNSVPSWCHWNLHEDSLDAQSDATLSFLGGLLG